MLVLTGVTMSDNKVVVYQYSKLEVLSDGGIRLVNRDERPDL
uniref:Uncharacterized protein n=1 Tax=Klebsiella phage FKP3 TaxID=3231233 RepID=A0AAU8HZP6_9CAUD